MKNVDMTNNQNKMGFCMSPEFQHGITWTKKTSKQSSNPSKLTSKHIIGSNPSITLEAILMHSTKFISFLTLVEFGPRAFFQALQLWCYDDSRLMPKRTKIISKIYYKYEKNKPHINPKIPHNYSKKYTFF